MANDSVGIPAFALKMTMPADYQVRINFTNNDNKGGAFTTTYGNFTALSSGTDAYQMLNSTLSEAFLKQLIDGLNAMEATEITGGTWTLGDMTQDGNLVGPSYLIRTGGATDDVDYLEFSDYWMINLLGFNRSSPSNIRTNPDSQSSGVADFISPFSVPYLFTPREFSTLEEKKDKANIFTTELLDGTTTFDYHDRYEMRMITSSYVPVACIDQHKWQEGRYSADVPGHNFVRNIAASSGNWKARTDEPYATLQHFWESLLTDTADGVVTTKDCRYIFDYDTIAATTDYSDWEIADERFLKDYHSAIRRTTLSPERYQVTIPLKEVK